jgi:hypothetical protein
MNAKIDQSFDTSLPTRAPVSAHSLTAWLNSARGFITHLSQVSRGFVVLLVLALAAFSTISPMFPRSVTPASAPLDQFSAERAFTHLTVIAREPHPAGSPAQAGVRDYLVEQLSALGLEVEIQQAPGLANVVARLHGSDPRGAILIQAHYDSMGGPGAADNGAGTAALLEIMRSLSAGPALRNDVIALFDDSEELPDTFTGTKAFIRAHPWIGDVRVVIGMDTAVRGFICVDDTGTDNGWMVHVLERAYTGGAWTSISGGGNYDTKPFRQAGIRVLELEDNYPFYEQHTPADIPEIVNPGTLQQLGEQALAVTREIGWLDLSNTSGAQEAFIYLPILGLVHYPETWAPPLVILAGILFVIAFSLALWRKIASWRGLGVAFLATIITVVLSFFLANALWKAAPDLFDWEIQRWSEWPEVIPPHGWQYLILTYFLVAVLAVIFYKLTRRWSGRADFSLIGLAFIFAIAVVSGFKIPQAAMQPTWVVLSTSAIWIAAIVIQRDKKERQVEAGVVFTALAAVMLILPLIPGVFMGDGTKSVAITAGVWAVLLGMILPAGDGLFVRGTPVGEPV